MDLQPSGPPLRFALFGPVQAWRGAEPVDLGPPQRRAVLAMLLLNAGRVLGVDQIVDGLWGERAPEKAPAAVQAHISVLRRVLEPGRARRAPSTI
ncbi:MAG: AfsR/SARP family transcriptional regulator, partial [Candidatus Dormibacteria bacterium]